MGPKMKKISGPLLITYYWPILGLSFLMYYGALYSTLAPYSTQLKNIIAGVMGHKIKKYRGLSFFMAKF